MTLTLADGRVLAYSVAGDPAGVPVVFHHGTPGSDAAGEATTAPVTRAGLFQIRPCRPGYGLSTAQPGRRVADVADDVRQLLDHLGLDRVLVYGWSGGGPHALATAAGLGARVTGCALLAGVAPYGA